MGLRKHLQPLLRDAHAIVVGIHCFRGNDHRQRDAGQIAAGIPIQLIDVDERRDAVGAAAISGVERLIPALVEPVWIGVARPAQQAGRIIRGIQDVISQKLTFLKCHIIRVEVRFGQLHQPGDDVEALPLVRNDRGVLLPCI